MVLTITSLALISGGAYLLVRLLASVLAGLFKLLKLAGYLFLTVVVIYAFVDPGGVVAVLRVLAASSP